MKMILKDFVKCVVFITETLEIIFVMNVEKYCIINVRNVKKKKNQININGVGRVQKVLIIIIYIIIVQYV